MNLFHYKTLMNPGQYEKLYRKYGLTENEINLIDLMICPMNLSLNTGEDE